MKNTQEGIISLFILFSMLILLVFTVIMYFYVDEQRKLQEYKNYEYKQIYSKNYQEISNVEYANSNEIIPIYNADEFNNIGTNNYLQIKNKIYECGRDKSYVLKDNIIIDIEEKIKTNQISFNDFKLFSVSYLIDKASYDLYYYGYNRYWKVIAYKKYDGKNIEIEKESHESNEFFEITNFSFVPNNEYEFLLISFKDGKYFTEQYQVQRINVNKILNLNELLVFSNNKKDLENCDEYYLFVSIGNSI